MSPKVFTRFLKPGFIILALLCIGLASHHKVLDRYELASLDLRFVLRWPNISTSDKIVFIEIGQDTIDKLGRFPFDRNYHAILIKALSESGAKMIFLDILFSEPQEHDRELAYALNQAGNVYLAYAFDIDKTARAKELSARGYVGKCLNSLTEEARGTGHINIIPDSDGKFRRVPLFIKYEDTFHPYISFMMGCDHLGIHLKDVKFVPGKYIRLRPDAKIPLDEDSNMIVNFSGKWGTSYRHYSYIDVLQSYFAKGSAQTPILDLSDFKDKICIVGLTATGTGDVHPTPFESISPGIGIHAEVMNSIINRNFISRSSRAVNLFILLILGIFVSLIALKIKPVRGIFVLSLGIMSFAALAFFLFSRFGIWIDTVYPIFAMVLLYLAFIMYMYIAEWKARIVFENELDIAKKIQESFLPKKMPQIEGIGISALMLTARQVGGDLYDFVEMGNGRFGVMIGDVSGKGVPASLFMAMVVGSFKSFSKSTPMPGKVLASLNSKLVSESASDLFVTVFYTIFDTRVGLISYSNGGHLPLMRVSRSGEVALFDSKEGLPLGLAEGAYSDEDTKFNTGDVFIFYTDGVTEAMNARSELYGIERLERIVKAKREMGARDILAAIVKDIRRFEPKSKQHDDITIIVVKV